MYNSRKISLVGVLVGLLLFTGCSQEEGVLSDESSGKTGTVQISVDGVEELSDDDVVTRSLTDEKENSTVFTQTLDNGYTLVCTLEKERRNNIKTRASVPAGIQYCIVAYKDGGDAEADSRQAIFTTGSVSGLTLPPGTYQLYAYSYNRSTVEKLSGNDLRDARIPYKESVDKQFLYWRGSKKVIVAADGMVTNGNISILFRRQTCELKIMLDGRDTGTQITGGGISVSPFRSGFFDTRLSNGGTWNMSTIQNESGDLNLNRPVNINNMASSVCYIIPKATEDRRTVKLIDISINSEPGKKSKTFAFTKKFERGYKYTLRVRVTPPDYLDYIEVNGIKWARSNSYSFGGSHRFQYSPYLYADAGVSYWKFFSIMPGYGVTMPAFVGPSNKVYIDWNKHKMTGPPCPSGYRIPYVRDFESLIAAKHYWGQYNGVSGMFFNTSTQPSAGTEYKYLFLPAAGGYLNHVYAEGDIFNEKKAGYYWSSEGVQKSTISPDPEDWILNKKPLSGWQASSLVLKPTGAEVKLKYCAGSTMYPIRCVKER